MKFAPVLVVLLLLLFWEFSLPFFHVPHYILPVPTEIIAAFWGTHEIWWEHMMVTLSESVLGLFISMLVAIFIALPMHRYDWIRHSFYPVVVVTQTIPILAISPLFIIWFDYTIWSKVAVVVLWTFFPIMISLNEGLRASSREKIEGLLSLGATRWQVFKYLEFPAALPFVFAGLQMAAAYSVAGATVGEWLGASEGLGFFARRASNNLQVDLLFVAVAWLCLLGMCKFYLVKWIGQRVVFWQK